MSDGLGIFHLRIKLFNNVSKITDHCSDSEFKFYKFMTYRIITKNQNNYV